MIIINGSYKSTATHFVI